MRIYIAAMALLLAIFACITEVNAIPTLDLRSFIKPMEMLQYYEYNPNDYYSQGKKKKNDDDDGDDDNWSNDDDDDDDDNDIPLDGGLSFLAIAGAGLGIKKVRDNMSKKKNEQNNNK